MSDFEDHFSQLTTDYALYRPHYPAGLFAYLAALAPHRRLAWDCGTGNGQAATSLAAHFERVIATDASRKQISQAFAHPQVEYRVKPAEQPDLGPHTVALVTVATAVHWFDLDRFYAAVQQAAVPGGVLAVWGYQMPVIEPALEAALARYAFEVLDGFWPERWGYIRDRYQSLPFPFAEIAAPAFEMRAEWDLHQLAGFLTSWSAAPRYQAARGQHPLQVIWPELAQAWGPPEQARSIRWPLFLRVGRTSA